MMFVLCVSFLGSAIGIRILRDLIVRELLQKKEMTKIGTAYFSVVLVLNFILPRNHLALWISVFVPLILISLTLLALLSSRSASFRAELREALTLTSLKMKAGKSFRQAYSEVAIESDKNMRTKLSEIGSVVVFSQQKEGVRADPFVAEVISELTMIDRLPHSAARRLAVYREKLRTEDDFRRRSGQALARIRAQSLIMSGLYIAMAGFIAMKFGLKRNFHFFVWSAVLFLLGTIWVWRGGRKLKWKV